ncbi:MAG: DegV family protein [Clostridia bacterium]|nr:DegV family protein [Clostridia bacterium]
MAKIRLLTDSASDISEKHEKKYNIKVVPFKIAVGDKSYVSRVDFNNEKFYDIMESYDGLPLTSQVTAFEFEEVYEEMFRDGVTDLICVLINSTGSATYNNSLMAADSFFEEHPEAVGKMRITSIDSRSYTGAYGYPVVEGAKMAQRGASASEIIDFITHWVENATVFFALYSLKYARKSGRIPGAAAFVGDALGLKPIMRIYDHVISTETKVRGEKPVVSTVVQMTAAEIEPQTPYCIVYGNDPYVAEDLAKAMTQKLGYPPADYYQIGAAIAVNAGPRVVGTIFKKKR